MSNFIAWIDVETTGINSPPQDKLLEVACLITNTNLDLLDGEGYESLIKHTGEEVATLRANVDPFVNEMHTKNGIWEKLGAGKPLSQVDDELSHYIRRYTIDTDRLYLGGNSITLDRDFLRYYLPKTFATLHYRSIDMTSISLAMQWWGKVKNVQKSSEHTALADIRESVKEAKYYKDIIEQYTQSRDT